MLYEFTRMLWVIEQKEIIENTAWYTTTKYEILTTNFFFFLNF